MGAAWVLQKRRSLRIAAIVLALFAISLAAYLFWSMPPPPLAPGTKVASIVVRKAARTLQLIGPDGKVVRTYKVALGSTPRGHKQQQGDGKTPEGRYRISGRNPNSRFHLSLRISYPNAEDRRQARRRGVSPGGDIMIHGLPNGRGWIGPAHRRADWTNGCIAVTDREIEEIWRVVPVGTPIELRP